MKQVFAAGTAAPDTAGPRRPDRPAVRGITLGADAAEVSAALATAGYAPPPAHAAGSDAPLPVRLALLNTPAAGRVLTHVAPDAAGGYFAHALLHVPASADAQLAIQTWGSTHWQRAEPEGTADLPEMPYLPVADVLDDAALKEWLAVPARREVVEFVLAALLATDPHARITLAAPADEVAKVVYAVTRALPHGMLDDFTFSTYEADPAAATARLVGHDTGSPDWDLPPDCYDRPNVGFNPASGKRSELPAAVPFAGFAADALGTGDLGPLDELKGTWQRLGMTGARQFDLVYRLARGTGVLTKDEAAEALQSPPLVAWVSARADALNQFLEWSLEDRGFASGSFSRVVQALRQKPDLLAKLAQTVRDEGVKAVRGGDRDRAANALEVVLPMVAPAKSAGVWADLLGQVPDPAALSWEMRSYLLPRLVRAEGRRQPTPAVAPGLRAWLDVPTDRLADLLALDLPRAYLLAAATTALHRDGEPSPALARALAVNPPLTLSLLKPADGPAAADKPARLFETLIAEAPEHPWFEDLLANAGDYPAELLNRYFEGALTAGKVDADRVIRTRGPRLLELFAGQSGLDRLGKMFLADPPADLLSAGGILGFLGHLRDEPGVSAEVKARVGAVQAVKAYLDAPTFDPAGMTAAAAGLSLSPPVLPPATKGQVFEAVANALLHRAGADGLQDDLEAALVHFGGVLANDPTDMYENLLRDLRGEADIGRSANLVGAFLAVALGAAKEPALAGKLDGLDGHAFALASDAAKRGGSRLLDAVDRRAQGWPKPARVQWGFLKAAVKPAGVGRVVRDGLLFVLGAAVASAGWWVAGMVR